MLIPDSEREPGENCVDWVEYKEADPVLLGWVRTQVLSVDRDILNILAQFVFLMRVI